MLSKVFVGLIVASISSYSAFAYAQADYMQQRDAIINQTYKNMYNQTYSPDGRRLNQYGAQAGQNQGEDKTCEENHCDTRFAWCRQERQMMGCD